MSVATVSGLGVGLVSEPVRIAALLVGVAAGGLLGALAALWWADRRAESDAVSEGDGARAELKRVLADTYERTGVAFARACGRGARR